MYRWGWLTMIAKNDLSEEHWIYIYYSMLKYFQEGLYFIVISRISYEDIMPDNEVHPQILYTDDYLYGQLLLQLDMTSQILICFEGTITDD